MLRTGVTLSLRANHVSGNTRVLLLLLADDYMRPDLSVSVNRKTLAKRLGLSERRVADRFQEAVGEKVVSNPDTAAFNHANRLLDRVVRGQKNAQAVYQGLMPNAGFNVTPSRHVENTVQHDTPQHVETDQKRHVENPDLSVKPESQRDAMASCLTTADLTPLGCPWHDESHPCPTDCRNHPQNREAFA